MCLFNEADLSLRPYSEVDWMHACRQEVEYIGDCMLSSLVYPIVNNRKWLRLPHCLFPALQTGSAPATRGGGGVSAKLFQIASSWPSSWASACARVHTHSLTHARARLCACQGLVFTGMADGSSLLLTFVWHDDGLFTATSCCTADKQ